MIFKQRNDTTSANVKLTGMNRPQLLNGFVQLNEKTWETRTLLSWLLFVPRSRIYHYQLQKIRNQPGNWTLVACDRPFCLFPNLLRK